MRSSQRASTATPELRQRVRAIIESVREGGDAVLRDINCPVRWRPADDRRAARAPAHPARGAHRGPRRAAAGPAPGSRDHGRRTSSASTRPRCLRRSSGSTSRLASASGGSGAVSDRVAAYVPGGSAPLPSSLLMSAIPARLAGVRELVVATPTGRDGRIAPCCSAPPASWRWTSCTSWAAPRRSPRWRTAPSRPPRRQDRRPGSAWVTEAKLQVLDRRRASTCPPDPPR